METYIQVSFWLGVFAIAINLVSILVIEYPRQKKETLGEKLFAVLIGCGFAVWAGALLFSN